MNIMGELAIIFGLCLVSEGISALIPVSFPASVIALLLLALLLLARVLKPEHIQRFSTFMAANMAFFFLPPCVEVMGYAPALLGQLGPFLLISFLTVPLVYGATAWVVQLLIRLAGKGGGPRA